ncbi:MAG: tetratricopeptide repeat protein [Nitrosopumilus sp.]
MGFLDKFKKSIEIKENIPSVSSLEKTEQKILELEKKLKSNPNDSKIYFELYTCYVETSNLEKKIECLEKLCSLLPDDFYPHQQLADIFLNELNDENKAKFYQNKANDLKNNF